MCASETSVTINHGNSSHRSPTNCLLNILSGLVAYTHQPQKPSLNLTPEEIQQLEALSEAQLLVA